MGPWAERTYESLALHIPYILILSGAAAFAAWGMYTRSQLDQTSQSFLLAAAFAGLGMVFLPHGLLDLREPEAAFLFFSPASRFLFGLVLLVALAGVPVPSQLRGPRISVIIAGLAFALVVDVAAHSEWIVRLLGPDPRSVMRLLDLGALALEIPAILILLFKWARQRRGFLGTITAASFTMAASSFVHFASSAWQWRWWIGHVGLLTASTILIIGVARRMARAIDQEELILHYQPKIELRTGRVSGVEALVRWQHPERGYIPPDGFLPQAERGDLMKPMTLWILRAALRQHRAWLDAGYDIPVAVNLSARLLAEPDVVEVIRKELGALSLQPKALELELTESAVIEQEEVASKVLTTLALMGVKLSIDDYGTGYSSLDYLRRLPVHQIKIDKSFVRDIVSSESDRIIVRSTVELGHNLERQLVAEGVEDEQVVAVLDEMGCDVGQGYHWSRPLPPDELRRWVAEYSARPV